MSNDTIQAFIDALNNGSRQFVLTQIGKNVWWGNAWHAAPPDAFDSRVRPEKLFFIKEPGGKFAAGVFWHGKEEIHWYVDPAFRRKGVLVRPLKDVVLPFLFKKFKLTVQRGSIDKRDPHSIASARLAKKVGFECIDDEYFIADYRLRKTNVKKLKTFKAAKPSKEDAAITFREIRLTMRDVKLLADRLMTDCVDALGENQVESLVRQIDDLADALHSGGEDFRHHYGIKLPHEQWTFTPIPTTEKLTAVPDQIIPEHQRP